MGTCRNHPISWETMDPLPFIFSIPHGSGRLPPGSRGLYALTDQEIADSVDTGTLEIFGELRVLGKVQAEWSRLVVDLNRSPRDRSPKGVVALVDYQGRRIYLPEKEPAGALLRERLRTYYLPYHRRLNALLAAPGVLGLFDCHSLNGVGPIEAPDAGRRRRDINLGNRALSERGAGTCPARTLAALARSFEEQGFSVSLNDPYEGGFITARYGRLLRRAGRFAVQIEINQDLYVSGRGGLTDEERVIRTRKRVELALRRFSQWCVR